MKIKFLTLGCKVNQYETQGLREKFKDFGFFETEKTADIYIVNTCSVTKKADNKSKEAILRAKKENPQAKIAVCGCLVELNRDFIENLGVDYVVAQGKKYLLPEIITGFVDKKQESIVRGDNWLLQISDFFNQRAFIKIQDGCNNLCSYCKIPYLRGPSRSRNIQEAIDEVKRLSAKHREIVLTGVNLSLYGKDLIPESDLQTLVEDILEIPQLGRLRLSSLEPIQRNDQLFKYLNNEKFCPHFHFPFQYGDDQILAAMNKEERVSLYEDLVFNARKIFPDVAISCDIMVGFPGEDQKTFQNTVEFIQRIKPMRMHIFTFSPREGTKFYGMKIKGQHQLKNRLVTLKDLAAKFSFEYASKFINKRLFIVSEEHEDGKTCGYTENYLKVHLKGEVSLGELIPVMITRVAKNKIYADIYGQS